MIPDAEQGSTAGTRADRINTTREQSHIYTVKCKVSRLYSNGVKLSEQARQTQPKNGRLLFAARIRHQQIRLTVFTAQMLELKSEDMVCSLNAAQSDNIFTGVRPKNLNLL